MAVQLLVPFNSHLQFEDIISVIEQAAKPGMRIVFLIRYPVDPWEWFRDHWITTESSRDAMLAGRKITERYSQEGQRALGEEMVAPWRHALQKMGVKTTVEVYTGSLSDVVENYRRGDETSLVMRTITAKGSVARFREVRAATIMRTTPSEKIERRATSRPTRPMGTESK